MSVQSAPSPARNDDRDLIRDLDRKVHWLSAWTIHNANHLRESRDGLKVGGHQASSTSLATVMSALYFSVLRPEDRIAVKPHASPVFHAIQYLYGRQSLDQLQRFRSLGGAGYFAPTMALSIGCLRAITFGDPAAIIWLDASPTVWQVLLAQLVFQVLVDVAVRRHSGLHDRLLGSRPR
jgi:hypothetical protein